MTEFVLPALFLFGLRLVNMSLATLRLMMTLRGRKILTWVFAFIQACLYIVALSLVLSDLGNWSKILGYAAGFATGTIIGMLIEERLAVGHTHLRIISISRGAEITEGLRAKGYGVTEIPAQGRDGAVTLLNCAVLRRQVKKAKKIISEIDPQAFVTIEDVSPLKNGYWPK